MYFNSQGKEEVTYDAIVIGSGISGGWAAKELSEKGLKTLVLERGRDVKHVVDYPTMHLDPWDMPNGGKPTAEDLRKQGVQARTGYTVHHARKHFFVNDLDHPYSEVKRFDWMRGYHVGGRSLMWGRHCYRWSKQDFTENARDGFGVDWPIRYKDIEPWYDYVESFVGISGQAENHRAAPDGKYLPPFKLNCLESDAREKIQKAFPERLITPGRVANLSQPHNGRGACQRRNRCMRGCPYGGYFSSQSSTLPAAMATGNMTLRPHSIVHEIIYDKESKRAKGVRIIDELTKETKEYFAKVIFCCASAIASTSILLNSKSDAHPDGMGNESGELGHNLMDHHFKVRASGTYDGFGDKYYKGRRPAGFYIPRFQNIGKGTDRKDYVRGFGYQGSASRSNWASHIAEAGVGKKYKDDMFAPGPWRMGMMAFAEMLPYHENRMYLNEDKRDKWGLPTVTFDCEIKDNEKIMRKHMATAGAEMLEAAGFKNISTDDEGSFPGLGIHEMGTARMGRDPKTSVLNGNNQVHSVPNVFVTDGACMTSSACQNPSITYMALTARACDFAVKQLNRNEL